MTEFYWARYLFKYYLFVLATSDPCSSKFHINFTSCELACHQEWWMNITIKSDDSILWTFLLLIKSRILDRAHHTKRIRFSHLGHSSFSSFKQSVFLMSTLLEISNIFLEQKTHPHTIQLLPFFETLVNFLKQNILASNQGCY